MRGSVDVSSCSYQKGRRTVAQVTMFSIWDLGNLFLSIPVIVSVWIGFFLALCIYIDRLLDLNDTVPEMAEVPTGNQTPTLPAPAEGSGKYPRDSPELENIEEGEEQLPLIALSPLYSWLMEENLLFEICEKEERSTSESTAHRSSRTPRLDVSANPPEKPDLGAGNAVNYTVRELPSSIKSSEKSGNGWQTSEINSPSTDHKISTEADGGLSRTEEPKNRNQGSLVMSTTEGKIRVNDDVGEISVLGTENGVFGCRGCDVKDGEVSRCGQSDVMNRECRQCDAWDAEVSRCNQYEARNSGCRQSDVWDADVCRCNQYEARNSGCRQSDVWDADVSGCGCPGLQQQPAVCYEDDWMLEYFQLLNELDMERRMTESLTLQLARQTLDLQLVQKRNFYLEDCLRRLVMREAETSFSCEERPMGPRCGNCGQKDSRRGSISLERAAEADTDAKQVAQSCGTMKQVECQAEKLGCQLEHRQCGMEHRRCQMKSGSCKMEQCQTEPDSCQQKRRMCDVETCLCNTEQGQCQMEQKRCQIEQRQCQKVRRQCCIEQGRCHNERELCQMEQNCCKMKQGQCQMEQKQCKMEQGQFQMEQKQCQMEQGQCQMEQKQRIIQPKVLQTEQSSHEMQPSRSQQEQNLDKTEPRVEKEPRQSKENPGSRHLEHQASMDTVPDAAKKNGHDGISLEDQTNPTRNPHVKTSHGGLVLASCDPSHFNNSHRTSGPIWNQMEHGTSNPYDPDDRAGFF